MAVPLSFQPKPVDPQVELERRLAAAPREHAEALLVVYDLLQSAHDKGVLDAVHGAISARDKIFGQLAELARTTEGENMLRNMLQLGKVLASVDPELLERLSNAVTPALADAGTAARREKDPPSLWRIFRQATSREGRRGLAFMTSLLTGLGRSLD
jgi:uncharacterized protein YjgD (DUF1641 family)